MWLKNEKKKQSRIISRKIYWYLPGEFTMKFFFLLIKIKDFKQRRHFYSDWQVHMCLVN